MRIASPENRHLMKNIAELARSFAKKIGGSGTISVPLAGQAG
jgi:hypothetical protein